MKKALVLIILSTLILASCKKPGHVYRASYTTPRPAWKDPGDLSGSIASNFFFMDNKDSLEAVNWYKKTDAYKDIITKCDSFWITYECTASEWGEHKL